MIGKVAFSSFFKNLIKFDMSPVSGAAHIVTVFHLFPRCFPALPTVDENIPPIGMSKT